MRQPKKQIESRAVVRDPVIPGPRERIVVVMGTDMSCFREAIRGINAYATTEASWHLDWFSPADDFMAAIVKLKPKGVILGPTNTQEEVQLIRQLVPHFVGCLGLHEDPEGRFLSVESDDRAVGQIAAQYFLAKGYRHFAYFGTHATWSSLRQEGFSRAIQAATGMGIVVLEGQSSYGQAFRGWSTPRMDQTEIEWLTALPKPLALFVCNDIRARAICELCLDAGIRVPEEIAILGVDNDDLECEVSHPPLSSVQIPWRQAGYTAAELLAQSIGGSKMSANAQRLPPIGVVERQSTSTFAISDPEVSMALEFIRKNAHRQIGVADVLRTVPAARRTFEKRFRTAVGRSPLDEIRRAHVDRAKQLLLGSDLPMAEIAERSGFASAAWFTKTFCDLVGETPSAFRARVKRK